MSAFDFIFCPFCGETEWVCEQIQQVAEGRLHEYKCKDCKKFNYTNISYLIKDTILHAVTGLKKYNLRVEVYPYLVDVAYLTNKTTITDADTHREILTINKVLDLNWYREEEIREKLKFYLVFS